MGAGATTIRPQADGEPSRERRISSVVRALDVLADPWTFLIIREAFFGFRRFGDFQRNLQIARNVLADRLSRLVAQDILRREQYQERPPRFEYRLTAAGRDFYPAIVALMSWGDRWQTDADGPPLVLTHTTCGQRLEPIVICSSCGETVTPFSVLVEDGPGAGFERGFDAPATRQSNTADLFLRGRPCSVARSLSVIGDRWSLRILRESFLRVKRFSDFQKNLEIARNILASRLKRLVENGILVRRRYQERPARYEYVLSQAGLDLYQSLLLFLVWGDRWRAPDQGPPTRLVHMACGRPLGARLVCATCREPVDATGVDYEMKYDFRVADT